MVDYQKVYEAFIKYAADQSQAKYNELWVVCWQRMRALCYTRYGQCSDPEDLDDIINTATIRVLSKLQSLNDCDTDTISKNMYWSLRNSAGPFFRKKIRRNKIMEVYVSDIESAAKILLKK